jgi:hypothetical protein
MEIEKKDLVTDVLNILIIVIGAYLILSFVQSQSVESYGRLAVLKSQNADLNLVHLIPIVLGVLLAGIMYLISRIVFKQDRLSILISSLLMITTPGFINNFSYGTVSDLTFALFGNITAPSFDFMKIEQVISLLPLSLISLYVLYTKKKNAYLFTGIVGIIAAFFFPLLSLPILFILTADGVSKINHIKDKSTISAIAGGVIAAGITLLILNLNAATFALSLLVALVIGIVVISFENKRTLLYLLTIAMIMISIEAGLGYYLGIQRVDNELIQILDQVKDVDGKIGIASYYKGNVTNIAFVEINKNVVSDDAFIFLFTNKTPNLDYLVLDTVILDNPKEYTRLVNASVTFETFMPVGMQKQSEDYYYMLYVNYKNEPLLIPVTKNGNLIGNNVIINGISDSYFKLVSLNATDPKLERMIHPRSDSEKNIFKVLFPDQFGEIKGYSVKEIAQSNSSRYRLYQIVKIE